MVYTSLRNQFKHYCWKKGFRLVKNMPIGDSEDLAFFMIALDFVDDTVSGEQGTEAAFQFGNDDGDWTLFEVVRERAKKAVEVEPINVKH